MEVLLEAEGARLERVDNDTHFSRSPKEDDESAMHHACLEPDATGVTRFQDVPLSFAPFAYASPAPQVDISSPLPAASMVFVSSPPGWEGALRSRACRQLFLCMAGEVEVRADEGEPRCFRPGSALVVAAGAGREYPYRVVELDGALIAVVQLDD